MSSLIDGSGPRVVRAPRGNLLSCKTWQAEAKTHLLAAQLASRPDQSELLKNELRTTVEELADLQIEQAAGEVRQWEAKLRRAEGQRKKLETGRSEFVDRRMDAILQAVGRLESGANDD